MFENKAQGRLVSPSPSHGPASSFASIVVDEYKQLAARSYTPHVTLAF